MSASPAIFDAEMRDSQARGRGLHEDSDDYGADNLSISGGARHHYQRYVKVLSLILINCSSCATAYCQAVLFQTVYYAASSLYVECKC